MPRTRIREDQTQDISFVSEDELNQFFGKNVISGTLDDTIVLEDFDSFFPGRGLIVSQGQLIVATGTNFVSISGGDASSGDIDDLQVQIDALVFEQSGVGSITVSGVTLSGALVFEGLGTVSLSIDGQIITFSGSGSGSDITSAITDINGEVGPSIVIQGAGEVSVSSTATNEITISGTPHPENTDTVSDAIIGGENITVVSGANTTTISSPDTITDAIVGAGEVVVTSGVSTITISGTPHTVNTDTISDAIIGVGGIVVTSGTDTTTISGGADFDFIVDDEGILYRPDPTRSGTVLSIDRESLEFGRRGNLKNIFLAVGDVNNSDAGYVLPRPATIVATASFHLSGIADFHVVLDGDISSPILETSSVAPGAQFKTDHNVNVPSGVLVQVFMANPANAVDPSVTVEVAWRFGD